MVMSEEEKTLKESDHNSLHKNYNQSQTDNELESDDKSEKVRDSKPPKQSISINISQEKIEELKKRKLDSDKQEVNVPGKLKLLSIFSMIGSGSLFLIFFNLIASGYFGSNTLLIFILFNVPFVLKFIGAFRMYKGKKSGFLIYMIPSGIFNFIVTLSVVTGYQKQPIFTIILVGSMIIFSIIFYNYKTYLK